VKSVEIQLIDFKIYVASSDILCMVVAIPFLIYTCKNWMLSKGQLMIETTEMIFEVIYEVLLARQTA
jgi:hypothetical protein